MTSDVQVMADGTSSTERPKQPPRSPWVLVVLAFVLGFGLGVIAVSPPSNETAPTEEQALDAPVIADVSSPTESGLSELFDGFDNSLVAITDPSLGGFDRLSWPADGPLSMSEAILGGAPSLDSSGQLVSTLQSVPGLDGSILAMGRISNLVLLSSGVTSHRWHDSKSGHLSYTTQQDGQWHLWRVFTDLQPTEVAIGLVADGQVAAWGDWGWAIQTSDDNVLLLTPDGEIKTMHAGRALASEGRGWILVTNEHLEMVSAGGGVARLDVAADRVGNIRLASFSPDGDQVAIAGDRGVIVVSVTGGGETAELSITDAVDIAWSSDARFLAIPRSRGVSIFDLDTVTRESVLDTFAVVGAKLIAPSP